jgi:phosphoesterase RecJ-like protein
MANLKDAAECLMTMDEVAVLSHASPDGDTLGSASALMRALISMGKKVRFECSDEIPKNYGYLFDGIEQKASDDAAVVSVDVADRKLLGDIEGKYEGRVLLAIDHHGTHVPFGKTEWIDGSAAATAQMIFRLLQYMKVDIDEKTADCLYTGVTTDTGCFKYPNTTSETHRIAAELLDAGANGPLINRLMFETKTRACIEAEIKILNSLEFYADGAVDFAAIPRKLLDDTGAAESDLEGIPSITRGIEGVRISIILKEKETGEWKASIRAVPPADASVICLKFGGGGHPGAAGCTFYTDFGKAKKEIIEECVNHLKQI